MTVHRNRNRTTDNARNRAAVEARIPLVSRLQPYNAVNGSAAPGAQGGSSLAARIGTDERGQWLANLSDNWQG